MKKGLLSQEDYVCKMRGLCLLRITGPAFSLKYPFMNRKSGQFYLLTAAIYLFMDAPDTLLKVISSGGAL